MVFVSHLMALLLPGHEGIMCEAKYHIEQSAMPHTWWSHLLVSVGATSRFHNRVLSAPVIQTEYIMHLVTQQW